LLGRSFATECLQGFPHLFTLTFFCLHISHILFMSDEQANPSQTQSGSSTDSEEEPSQAQRDMHELLGELRAEVTRLKAEQAKEQAQNWIQRHPLLTVVLSMGVGAAAGYGASRAVRSRPPQSLSEHARQRLRQLSGDARKVASRLRERLGERATRSGEQLKQRAEQTGRRLAQEAQRAGESARREATERARQFGEEASERFREAKDEAAKRVQEGQEDALEGAQELGEVLGEQASEALDEYTESAADSTSDEDSRSYTRSLLTLAGIAAGGYLATKVRRWL
jgi:ElaB/YqjD/DUF883 family membrane-anchored ribosome-binding protein